MKGEPQLEELWEHRSPRENSIEEAFLALHGLPSYLADDIHVLFKESLTEAILKIFGESGATALMRMVSAKGFDDPADALANFEPIIGVIGSNIVKKAVADEFQRNVRQLIRKAERARKRRK